MRIIKALLVLVFLLPTLATAQPTPESFIRIERDENREPVALQTAIAKYVPVDSATGVEIDLVAVVHIGEQAYYRRLNSSNATQNPTQERLWVVRQGRAWCVFAIGKW
jgi:hypothetical protein